MGLFSKLFGKKISSGLPGLLELNTQSVSISAALSETFSKHFNNISFEMLSEFSDSESLNALSLFATVITKIKIFNSVCSSRSEQVQNDIEKLTGMSVACVMAQVQVIDDYVKLLTDNIQTSKLQSYVKSQIDGCNSTINTIISMTRDLGLESYTLYNVESFCNVLENEKTQDYIVKRVLFFTT